MECINCGYEWKTRKIEHKGCWHCPKCHKNIKDTCPNCGHPKQRTSKYCKDCAYKFPTWDRHYRLGKPMKNGFYITHQPDSRTSYKMVLIPSHPRANRRHHYVAEHILVWEEVHGKYLPDGWVIHHINGNGLDNRPQNLMALKKHHHSSWLLYQIACKRIRQLEEQISQQGLL